MQRRRSRFVSRSVSRSLRQRRGKSCQGRVSPRLLPCLHGPRFWRDRRPLSSVYVENAIKEANALAKELSFTLARQRVLVLEQRVACARQPRLMLLLAEAFNDFGYISDAERCCQKAINITERRCATSMVTRKLALYLLSAIAAEVANHAAARRISRQLLRIFPGDPTVLLYHIFHISYDPEEQPRRQKSWARYWAKSVTPPKGRCQRPSALPLNHRPLRVGYVSADFDIHPVGFFVRGVLPAHDPKRVQAFAYNAGTQDTLIIKGIGQSCTVRDVANMDDDRLEKLIRDDGIDVLVDLSGLTKGTRLPVFAREPAPVLVAWLGYWATTGLSCFDAVLLDDWHAPAGIEKFFTEPVFRLPVARFCFQPVSENPPVQPKPPCLEKGYVTFGSFNNTAKLTSHVLDAWGRILASVPDSRLLLKWKTFHDTAFRERIRRALEARGIDGDRVEFRGWSPHNVMLAEFRDMDIMLDCFPFTGGMTTCNALWMGVPVVTLAGETAVSRQGHAILGQLGLDELSAHSVDHYVNIATGLAGNLPLLTLLHATLRARMRASQLLDVPSFTRHLEDAFYQLYAKRLARDANSTPEKPT